MSQFDPRYAEQAREQVKEKALHMEMGRIGGAQAFTLKTEDTPVKPTLVEQAQEINNHLTVLRVTLEEVGVILSSLREGPTPTSGGDRDNMAVGQPDNLAGNLSAMKGSALLLLDMARNLSERMRQLRQEVGQLY